ncbi:MAG: hypothetical protein P8N49_02780 [Opitutales bacterium]|nr:hypothetical protein [Opitutales bacterium]
MNTKSKVTFSVDLNKDPDQIFEEIKLRIERELKRKGSGDITSAFLEKLHEICNEHVSSDFQTTNDLIRGLAPFASPAMKDRILDSSPTGRRKTISMDKELYDQICELLAKPDSNKAAIARKTGASVVQVRKIATGGYDKKYKGLKLPKVENSTPAQPKLTSKPKLPLTPPKPPSPSFRPVIKKDRSVTRPPMRLVKPS